MPSNTASAVLTPLPPNRVAIPSTAAPMAMDPTAILAACFGFRNAKYATMKITSPADRICVIRDSSNVFEACAPVGKSPPTTPSIWFRSINKSRSSMNWMAASEFCPSIKTAMATPEVIPSCCNRCAKLPSRNKVSPPSSTA